MKKLISILAAILLMTALAVPTFADLIWEPMDDFYTEHNDECVYTEDARYEAQTDVDVFVSPEDLTLVGTIPAGTEVSIEYVWSGETVWGSVLARIGDDLTGSWVEGWVDVSGFRKLYGAAEFETEHRKEFVETEGTLPVTQEQELVFWWFPGSGTVDARMGGQDFWTEEDTASYYRLWTDADGNDWAEVGYFYGASGWVYLPDPAADDLPATAPRYADDDPAGEQSEQTDPGPAAPEKADPSEFKGIGTITIVVVIVIAVGVIVLLFYPIKKKD